MIGDTRMCPLIDDTPRDFQWRHTEKSPCTGSIWEMSARRAKASLALSKYVVVDTFAKAIQSGDTAGAIKWGADQLQRIYG